MNDKTLATVEHSSMQRLDNLSTKDVALLKATVLKGASDAQLALFAKMCAKRGLDPFAREIHGKVNTDGGITAMVGIDGLRSLAEGSGEYAGQDTALYCGTDGEWREVWLGPGKPAAAKVCVRRRDRQTGEVQSTCNVALAAEASKSTGVWNTYFSVMLATRAEAAALRRAFPRQASGLYLPDEIQDDAPQATQSAPEAPQGRNTPQQAPERVRGPQDDSQMAIERGTPLATADAPVVMRRVEPPDDDVIDAEFAEVPDDVDASTGEIRNDAPLSVQELWREIHEVRRTLGWNEKQLNEHRAEAGLPDGALHVDQLESLLAYLQILQGDL